MKEDSTEPKPCREATVELELSAAEQIMTATRNLREENRELRKSERALNALLTVVERSDRQSVGYGEDPLWRLDKAIQTKHYELEKQRTNSAENRETGPQPIQ